MSQIVVLKSFRLKRSVHMTIVRYPKRLRVLNNSGQAQIIYVGHAKTFAN